MSPTGLADRLRATIRRDGPLRFDAFQQAALYDPDGGYYERRGRVGRSGDFVTGASWHPAFARCLLRIADRLVGELSGPLDLVDVGAGEGELLAHVAAARPGGQGLRLLGVEASATRRRSAAGRVPEARFVPDVRDLPGRIGGVVVAYELFDALPVRALRMSDDGILVERRVGLDPAGDFRWVEAGCQDSAALLASLERRGAVPEPGQLLELRPGAPELAREIARRIDRGVLLAFDYGAPTRALYGPARVGGTLEAFIEHRVTRDVLMDPGSRDITSWVDFGELSETVEEEGLAVRGLLTQSRLLLSSGIAQELDSAAEGAPAAARAAERNAIAKLFMPGGMGESIRVLVAERDTVLGKSLIDRPLV